MKKMKKREIFFIVNSLRKSIRLLIGCAAILLAACSGNLLSSVADTTSDAALFFDAEVAISAKNYGSAVTIIESMTATGQTARTVRLLKATAYGGLCGFEFLGLLQDLSDGGSTRLFATLLSSMKAADATALTNCQLAFDEVQLISTTAASRTSDENIFMTVLGLATVGVVLENGADSGNDGVADSYDHCAAFTDAQLNSMVAGVAETVSSISALGGSIAGIDVSSLTTACTALGALSFCDSIDPNAVTADERQGMKGLIGSDQSVGVGGSNNAGCAAGQSVAVCAVATGC